MMCSFSQYYLSSIKRKIIYVVTPILNLFSSFRPECEHCEDKVTIFLPDVSQYEVRLAFHRFYLAGDPLPLERMLGQISLGENNVSDIDNWVDKSKDHGQGGAPDVVDAKQEVITINSDNEEDQSDDEEWEDLGYDENGHLCDADDEDNSEENNSCDNSDYLDEADGSFITSTGVKKNPIKQYTSSGFSSSVSSSTFLFKPSPISARDHKDINEEVSIVPLYLYGLLSFENKVSNRIMCITEPV